ncbi:CATRA conflict system CASPASE/TPR repeat-associated protein [Nonomuraea sp. NPDC046570]|uniref:CATRA conflict system CASPASE/TPR repeat-associated protein n=1 Tax=Nonomuraea sp. NPDC046570 TaxID=3155255 RepID=UPI003408311E
MNERALVVHLFVAVRRAEGLERLREVWQRCGDHLGMVDPIPGLGGLELPDGELSGEVLGARQRAKTEHGIFQAVLRLRHDVLALSVVLAPSAGEAGDEPPPDGVAEDEPPSGGGDWDELDALWSAVVGDGSGWVLGEARIRSGVAEPPVDIPEGRSGLDIDGHTIIWEEPGTDGRTIRRISAIAVTGRQEDSDAWLWTRGDARFPPFGIHLLHAAKVRHQLRIRDKFEEDFGRLLDLADQTLERRHRLSGETNELAEVRQELSRLLSGPAALVQVASRLGEMERSVQIAGSNMRAVTGSFAGAPGPIADDLELADWLAGRLADDLLYAESAQKRVSTTLAEVVQTAQEAVQERRELLQQREGRVNLLQAAMVGSMIMVLTAVQALGYRVPLPEPVKPAVIASLGALALLLATLTLWRTEQRSRVTAGAVRVFAGLACAALSWLAGTVTVHLTAGGAASPLLTVGLAVPAFAAGALIARMKL